MRRCSRGADAHRPSWAAPRLILLATIASMLALSTSQHCDWLSPYLFRRNGKGITINTVVPNRLIDETQCLCYRNRNVGELRRD